MPQLTKEKWCSRLSEDEILDEFQTKTDCTKYSNTQKILLNGCHLLLKEYLQFISTNCAEKKGSCLRKVSKEVSLLRI